MEKSIPLNDWCVKKWDVIINRLHFLIHGIGVLFLFHYRVRALIWSGPVLGHVLMFVSELSLTLLWLLGQGFKWRPVRRTVYPQRLPADEKLPSLDVFICTADPTKEPTLIVMNTLISAMALHYPPNKLHVYLSDDAGSSLTFRATKEACNFAKLWIPFCNRYHLNNRCPQGYFQEGLLSNNPQFILDHNNIQASYEEFKVMLDNIIRATTNPLSKDHPPLIQVMSDGDELPSVVYIAREKRPSHPHHFKAGALNVVMRVSAVMSNSPYILALDCDMFCTDPTSARQAMCFHLDPAFSHNLAFVQFPQKFHNVTQTDIYDCQLRHIWPRWEGLDGLRGPFLSGTGFYIKRQALYGPTFPQILDNDLIQLNKYYGSSTHFINSMSTPNPVDDHLLQKELQLLASCTYDVDTEWGQKVGFRFCVVEDYFTGFLLHCQGWTSVYLSPSRPCFLGSSPTNLCDILIQNNRWYLGLSQIGMSRFSPPFYGPLRMSTSQLICYIEFTFTSFYFLPYYILAIVPQLCLLCNIPLYPQVSSPFSFVFLIVFISYELKHVQEVLSTGHSIRMCWNEQRMWMIKSLIPFSYAVLDTLMAIIGLRPANFLPTNKVVDDEQEERYRMGIYDFQAPAMFIVPLCVLYMLNVVSFVIGFGNIWLKGKGNEMLIQSLIPLFGIILQFPILEGMVLRKDKGRISPSISIISAGICTLLISLVSLVNHF